MAMIDHVEQNKMDRIEDECLDWKTDAQDIAYKIEKAINQMPESDLQVLRDGLGIKEDGHIFIGVTKCKDGNCELKLGVLK